MKNKTKVKFEKIKAAKSQKVAHLYVHNHCFKV